ncbi:MAG: c-type cytochrome, partial [Chloroflexota bacterium]|nr:c-type cytochrome [Chloroflexota bacterium]
MATRKWRWAALALGVAVVGFLALGLFAVRGQAAAAPDPARGKVVFDNSCALCHGAGGIGKVGPTLAGAAGHVQQMGVPPEQAGPMIIGLLRAGINGRMPGFPPQVLSDDDIANLGAYLFTLPPTTGENLYENPSQCAACHGPKGIGGIGPKLAGTAPIVA